MKVDCQAGVGLIGSELGGGPSLAAKYQAALESSATEYFSDNHVINCMCHSTENLYRWFSSASSLDMHDSLPSPTKLAECLN